MPLRCRVQGDRRPWLHPPCTLRSTDGGLAREVLPWLQCALCTVEALTVQGCCKDAMK